MTHRIALFTLLTLLFVTLLFGSLALTQDTTSQTTTEITATEGADGTLAVTGITLPGLPVFPQRVRQKPRRQPK
jgi:FlaG/FlaF family flagellin (archaellin)